jgi:hypothetical protein
MLHPMSEPRQKLEGGIRIMCPTLTCRKILAVPGAARGKTVRCKYCNASIRIPGKKESEPEKPEQAAA